MLERRKFSRLTEIVTKNSLLSSFLIANSFVWYYLILAALQNIADKLPPNSPTIWIWTFHFAGLLFSALGGASVSRKVERKHILASWIVLSGAASFVLLFLEGANIQSISLAGLFLGSSFGFGMPSCMSLFSDLVPIERRGRVSGMTILMTGIGLLSFSFVEIGEGLFLVATVAVWRLLSIAAFLSIEIFVRTKVEQQNSHYRQIVIQKSFLLYLLPWLMFSLVNYFTAPMVTTGTDIDVSLILVQAGFTGVFGVLGGFFVDIIGRKKVAIAGFVLLGIGTAILALNPTETTSQTSLFYNYFNAAVDGIAWGFLLVLFILTLWGDLSEGFRSEKYYALGAAPFFISKLLEITTGQYLETAIAGNEYAFFSFTTFFLLIAILPLVYAPETLPEKVMKDRDLKSYVEKAKKKMQKESENKQRQQSVQFKNDQKEAEQASVENSQEYEEAQRLAEKYY